MAKFKINAGQGNEQTVEADVYNELGSLIVFTDDEGDQVYGIPTSRVVSIELVRD